ncbi:cell wall elongation regulator TseB-like domain-containing protein [Bacillus sp. 2205SS5-2]|uniref:cell wall elongation regulator TseB-like domain-containing protein n=1 Tax=Bacillus sp. 2205SS5-2 TaxID=3109031 RepID=UPI003004494D
MNKGIIISIILFFCLLGLGVNIYLNAREPFESAKDYAINQSIENTEIQEVLETYYYNGKESLVSVVGLNAKNEKLIAFVPENKKKEITVQKWANGMSENEALTKLKNEKTISKLVSTQLGLENVGPVWEIAYLDQEEDLNYYYILFETGEWWRSIENL